MTKEVLKVVAGLGLLLGSYGASGAAVFPESSGATTDVELGVVGIQRICPTGMWDRWTFTDISYDRGWNEVTVRLQLYSWDDERDELFNEDGFPKKYSQWIVENFMEAFNDLTAEPRTACEGDFMLYISLGSLLHQMEKDGATLRIVLLRPGEENCPVTDFPMTMTAEELTSFLEK